MRQAADMGLGGSDPFLHAQAMATTMGMGTRAVATEMATAVHARQALASFLLSIETVPRSAQCSQKVQDASVLRWPVRQVDLIDCHAMCGRAVTHAVAASLTPS